MTTIAPNRSATKAGELSDVDQNQGVEILNSLQTVERAKRLKDSIPLAAANVVKNEYNHVEYVHFIRRVAGYEASAQLAVVAGLLVFCYKS